MAEQHDQDVGGAGRAINAVVHSFLHSNLSLVLILLAAVVGLAALFLTPREEDPQIVVPLADVLVQFPGHSAAQVEQLVATPLEKILYQIDGVEYVYSMSRENAAIITVRFYVGQDRERSLVKLFKKIDENLDVVPPGVTGWVVKPIEIDDVPIVNLTLSSGRSDSYTLRRVAEEMVQRLSTVPNLSRAYVVGGYPRQVQIYLDAQRLEAYQLSPLLVQRALLAANVSMNAGSFARGDQSVAVTVGQPLQYAHELAELVVGVAGQNPILLKDVAQIIDGPAEVDSYVRHGWGPARGFADEPGAAGTLLNLQEHSAPVAGTQPGDDAAMRAQPSRVLAAPVPAVTIAVAKKKGANAVWVADAVLAQARLLQEQIVPDDIELTVTRNFGRTADEKVSELVEGLLVAVVIVIALLTLSLGWREAVIVAVAVPVVFGLTLAVNLLLGFSINRVTLFALILSLGLLVDDPIVDVENIVRHFRLRKRATRPIVLEAVAEIRPPLISATLAVILSFLPLFFITGMMGPYMRPMALNVPVAMGMSMLVAFTITPWLAYHLLWRHYDQARKTGADSAPQPAADEHDLEALRRGLLWRLFYPLMAPLLRHRWAAWTFLLAIAGLTLAAVTLAATRHVPLKMLPFDNKNELLLVLNFEEGASLERSDAAVADLERYLQSVPEVVDLTSYVGLAAPMDFNGMVRHYYLRQGPAAAQIQVNLVGKKHRTLQSHALALRLRDPLTALAGKHHARLQIVETPPGPPVIATLVGEVYGQPYHRYEELLAAGDIVGQRLARESGVVEVDDIREAAQKKLVFVVDQEKAAVSGVNVEEIARTTQLALGGAPAGTLALPQERNPLHIELRLPRPQRSSLADLARLTVPGRHGESLPLAELGHWQTQRVDQTIYHKNLQRVVYVFAETAGRAPAEAVVDVLADRVGDRAGEAGNPASLGDDPQGHVSNPAPREERPLASRTFLSAGAGIPWSLPADFRVNFAGEGEWKITLDVFRDLGLAFAAALVAIYILLLWQTGSFVLPAIIMLAIPLTVLGVMPGFWLLNALGAAPVGPYPDPVFFTATGMIGMIALAGIVTRDAIILVDFIHLSLARGRSLFDALMESRVVRLRPILLTAGAAMLGAVPITLDPIFSGLAWSLIFGLLASTLFTLFVIPVAYWLLYAHKQGHGLEQQP